ncbi:MAG: HD domain-containing protein [Clostridia bacterium]|nr:HD domain-containing protein [Clostridia bacterium]MBQ9925235.1 HD domain-containing protein [Clostridia bacterium]
MEPKTFIEILGAAERLKDTFRHSYTSQGRRESVAEHCWRLSLMAMLLEPDFPELDMNKVLRMCILHDMGEAFTGDIPAFNKTDEHDRVEDAAISAWLAELPADTSKSFGALFAEMNAMETSEARLYKALDKLEALIQHNEADIETWLPLEYDLQQTYGNEECAFDLRIQAIRDRAREDTLKKIKEKNDGQKEN